MPYRRSCAACALAAVLLLSGCSAVTGSDVESLLRAPQASGGAHLKAAEGYPQRPAFSAVRQRLKQRKAQFLGLAA